MESPDQSGKDPEQPFTLNRLRIFSMLQECPRQNDNPDCTFRCHRLMDRQEKFEWLKSLSEEEILEYLTHSEECLEYFKKRQPDLFS